MLIRSITQNAMEKKFSIRQFPSPEHQYIAFSQKNLAVLDISRFTTGEIGPQSRLMRVPHGTICEIVMYKKFFTAYVYIMFTFFKERI